MQATAILPTAGMLDRNLPQSAVRHSAPRSMFPSPPLHFSLAACKPAALANGSSADCNTCWQRGAAWRGQTCNGCPGGAAGRGRRRGRPRACTQNAPQLPHPAPPPASALSLARSSSGLAAPLPRSTSCSQPHSAARPARRQQAPPLCEPPRTHVLLRRPPRRNQPPAIQISPPAALLSARAATCTSHQCNAQPLRASQRVPCSQPTALKRSSGLRRQLLAGERRRRITCSAPCSQSTLQLPRTGPQKASPYSFKVGLNSGG